MNQADQLPWERREIELAYVADCGGDGGWVVYTVNGRTEYDYKYSKELPHFYEHLNDAGNEGWELISIAGGPYVKLHYDYRHTLFQRPPVVTAIQWNYLVIDLTLRHTHWWVDRVNAVDITTHIRWNELLKQLQDERWQLIQAPFRTINQVGEAILKRQRV